jgi:hypothetical protein
MNGFPFNPMNSDSSNWLPGREGGAQPPLEGVNQMGFPLLPQTFGTPVRQQAGTGGQNYNFNWSEFFNWGGGDSSSYQPNQPGKNFDSYTLCPDLQKAWHQTTVRGINTALVEVGAYDDGTLDHHAQSVKQTYQDVYGEGHGMGHTQFYGIGLQNPQTNPAAPSDAGVLNSKEKLNRLIDQDSTESLEIMSNCIDTVVDRGKERVINGSLGFTRDDIYKDVVKSLNDKTAPETLTALGLTNYDLASMHSQDGNLVINPKIAKAVMDYVDNRLDPTDSAYHQSLARYQQTVKHAADQGVAVVVATGNSHKSNTGNGGFRDAKPGADFNFLAQSDDVISVAATDDKKTPTFADDTIAPFSSYGDGTFNPTVATNGVGVNTPFGLQDGTSFASPQVAATVARMLEANPNLSLREVKQLLQQTAYDSPASVNQEGAGIMDTGTAVEQSRLGYPSYYPTLF